jgi:MFS family permease
MKASEVFIDALAPLKKRDVSLFLGGQTISQLGSMMQGTALAWLVWELSKSTEALGIVNMLQFMPFLFLGAFAGLLADRLDRRSILFVIRFAEMALAMSFAFLLYTDIIAVWHIYIFALLAGIIMGIDTPVEIAYLGDLSGQRQVREAVAIYNLIRQAAQTTAPALAGLLLAVFNSSRVFLINGAAAIFALGTLLFIRSRPAGKIPETASGDSPVLRRDGADFASFIEGFRFVIQDPRMSDLFLLSICITFFSSGVINLIPAVVTERLNAGPETLGFIQSAAGAGPIAGLILAVPFIQKAEKQGPVLLLFLVWMGAWFIAAAYTGSPWFWGVSMFAANIANPAVLTVAAGLIQFRTPAGLRGRVMGIWMMFSFGMMPFGALINGFLSGVIGIAPAILIFGLALICIAAGISIFRKPLLTWTPRKDGGVAT